MGLPVSTYYYQRSVQDRPDKYEQVRPVLREVFDSAYRSYGYRRIRLVLARKHQITLSGKTVLRLMREEGRQCQVRKRKYRSYRGQIGTIAPNLLDRDFTAHAVDRKWVTDVTEFTINATKLYLSPIIDLFNHEVISYQVQEHPTLPLVTQMLTDAGQHLTSGHQLVLHSDQGWHYQHRSYREQLKDLGITQSMSRKGNCLDNAVAENFFGHFKEELLRQQKFTSPQHFTTELAKYIHWWNHDRIQERLKGLSPVEYRTQSLQVA